MSCNPTPRPPSPSDRELFFTAASLFPDLPPDAIPFAYGHLRKLLLAVAEGASDPNSYSTALRTLQMGEASLAQYIATNDPDALAAIRNAVAAACALVP